MATRPAVSVAGSRDMSPAPESSSRRRQPPSPWVPAPDTDRFFPPASLARPATRRGAHGGRVEPGGRPEEYRDRQVDHRDRPVSRSRREAGSRADYTNGLDSRYSEDYTSREHKYEKRPISRGRLDIRGKSESTSLLDPRDRDDHIIEEFDYRKRPASRSRLESRGRRESRSEFEPRGRVEFNNGDSEYRERPDSRSRLESKGGRKARNELESRGRIGFSNVDSEYRERPDSRSRLESRGRRDSISRPGSRSTHASRRRTTSGNMSRPHSSSVVPSGREYEEESPDWSPTESPTRPQSPPTHARLPFSKVKESARVNAVFLRSRDVYPFVVVTELGEGGGPSSRVSPYFPRGFKGHPPRKIKSAPPVRKPRPRKVPITTWQPNPRRRIPRLCNRYGRCQHDTPTRSLAGIVPKPSPRRAPPPQDGEMEHVTGSAAAHHHEELWNKTAGVMRVASHKATPAKPQKTSRNFYFPFATFQAKKFMKLRSNKTPEPPQPASSSKKMTSLLGLTSLGRMTHPKQQSKRFTNLAKLTRSLAGGRKPPPPVRPPSAAKFSAVVSVTSMGSKITGEVRPDWTIQDVEPEYVTCCFCCQRRKVEYSSDKIIRSKSLERMETIEDEQRPEGSEQPAHRKPRKKKSSCMCCCAEGSSDEEGDQREKDEKEAKQKPGKSKKKSCWGNQVSAEDVRTKETKLSDVHLLPGQREGDTAGQIGEMWATKTNSQDAPDYTPPKKKKRQCFWCCYKTEDDHEEGEITKTPHSQRKAGKWKNVPKNLHGEESRGAVQSFGITPKSETSGRDPRGLTSTKLKSQDSRQSELDCNRKCKICWFCCCCGCTCSNRPHMKSMAIQAMSADIRSSMLQLPRQLRVPSANESGDVLVIQSVLSGKAKQLHANADVSSGPSPDRAALDPAVQRSVSAVMRHLSPKRKRGGCTCFTCYKKSPEVHRKSVKRKTNWMCCTSSKRKKTSSQESLTSTPKLPPEIQPKGTAGEKPGKKKPSVSCWGKNKMSPEFRPVSARKRRRTLGERLCGWRRDKVPLKEARTGCCGWISKKKGPQPPAKKRRSLKELLCGCCKPKPDRPHQPKPSLARRLFCCCCKAKLGPGPSVSGGGGTAAPQPAGKRNSLPPLKPLTRPNLWKRIFCCQCQKSPNFGSRKSYGSKRGGDMASRASSLASFPKLEATMVEHSSMMKAAIPVLPICLAWTCLILNVFLPGTGTVLSGFLCVCFGKPRFSVKDSTYARLGALCVNFVIGIGQMFTIIFCFVGWGWSIWWGVIMLRLARKYRRIKQAEMNPNDSTLNQTQDPEQGH